MSPIARRLITLAVAALMTACASHQDEQAPGTETAGRAGPLAPVEAKRVESDEARSDRRFRAPAELASMSVSAPPMSEPASPPVYTQPTNTEKYQHLDDNPVRLAAEQPVSTFS